ncbi:MAG: hypothetical protein U0163_00970 [Gemmatimonadaceae bacterium]
MNLSKTTDVSGFGVLSLLTTHIAAGSLAVVLGFIALAVKKGGFAHRRAGIVFASAMVIMGVTGSLLALRDSPSNPSFIAGAICTYFVATALTTVRRPTTWTRLVDGAATVAAFALGSLMVYQSAQVWQLPGRALRGVPAPMILFLGSVLLLGAAGDVRRWRSGREQAIARLSRHLWRMCFAFFIATGSFFSIRSRVATIFPEAINVAPVRIAFVLLPFAAMFYFLWRVRHTPVVRLQGTPTPASR